MGSDIPDAHLKWDLLRGSSTFPELPAILVTLLIGMTLCFRTSRNPVKPFQRLLSGEPSEATWGLFMNFRTNHNQPMVTWEGFIQFWAPPYSHVYIYISTRLDDTLRRQLKSFGCLLGLLVLEKHWLICTSLLFHSGILLCCLILVKATIIKANMAMLHDFIA